MLGVITKILPKTQGNKEEFSSLKSDLDETIHIIRGLTDQIQNDRHMHPVLQLVDPDNSTGFSYNTTGDVFDSPQFKARKMAKEMVRYLIENPLCSEDEFIIFIKTALKENNYGKIFSQCFELRLSLFFAGDYIRFGKKSPQE